MSFYDDPIVDDNAKRSEESVNVVRSLFTRKNGFISREEIPDYGVDLDVELMSAGVGASSQKFPIQIKSAIKVEKVIVNGEEFISYQFKTSRLGYLAKRPPAYGIFALYDDTKQVCYFDYVDDIIRRLDENPEREGWREQGSVNMLLPFQILDAAVLPALHDRFVKRHQNSALMLQEHGPQFNIPTLEPKKQEAVPKVNFKDSEAVAQFLEQYGNWLYNEAEFAMLHQLLGLVSRSRLNNSPKLIFLAAITYTQIGHVIDAEYYIRKARRTVEVMQGEGPGMIEFAAARLEFMKGNTDYSFFLNSFREAIEQTESVENKLMLKINILFFELTKGLETDVFPPDYEQQIAALEKEIEAADLAPETKHLMKCHHSDSQFHFASRGELNLFSQVKLKDQQSHPMPMMERVRRMTTYIHMITESDKTVFAAYVFGRDQNHPLLKASAAHQMGQHFFAQRMNLFMMGRLHEMATDKAKFIESFELSQNYSLIAYNEFIQLNLFHTAHEALSIAYEINLLCMHITGMSIGQTKPEELLNILREIEAAYELQPFESRMTKLLEKLKQQSPIRKPLRDQTDEEIHTLAKVMQKAHQLPDDRLLNIIHDMHMVRKFEQEVTNPNLMMRQDMAHAKNPATHYASLPEYALCHRTLDLETTPSSDINWLLAQFSTILKKDNG